MKKERKGGVFCVKLVLGVGVGGGIHRRLAIHLENLIWRVQVCVG